MFKQSLARCAHDTWPNDDSTSDNSPRNGVLLVDDLQTEKWLDLKTDDQCRIDSSHRSMFCQRHVFLKNGPLFRLCSFFSNNFLQSQRDSNSYRRSRRRARWPLDNHHSPRHVFLKGTSPASFYLLLSFQQVTVNLFPMVGFEPWTMDHSANWVTSQRHFMHEMIVNCRLDHGGDGQRGRLILWLWPNVCLWKCFC